MSARSALILGGARSGKTARALAMGTLFSERYYVATAEALDDEMAARIARHRKERGGTWQTIEAPLALASAIHSVSSSQAVCVVDCLTLWLSNLLGNEADVEQNTADLCGAISGCAGTVILVSNEVGLGLVPETRLGRSFRDHQGRLNQAVAGVVEQVEFVAAGLPLRLK